MLLRCLQFWWFTGILLCNSLQDNSFEEMSECRLQERENATANWMPINLPFLSCFSYLGYKLLCPQPIEFPPRNTSQSEWEWGVQKQKVEEGVSRLFSLHLRASTRAASVSATVSNRWDTYSVFGRKGSRVWRSKYAVDKPIHLGRVLALLITFGNDKESSRTPAL